MRAEEASKLIDALKANGDELIAMADDASESFVAALRASQDRLLTKINALIADMPDMPTLSQKARLRWYMDNSLNTSKMLRASGYDKAAKEYIAMLEELATKAGVTAKTATNAFASVPDEFVSFMQKRTYEHLQFLGEEAIDKIDTSLLEMSVGGYSRGSMLSELKNVITGEYPWGDKTGLYEWHAGTYVRTSAQRSSQLFMNYQAEKYGIDNFIYVGPLDENTRTFCRRLLGEIHSRAEINKMHNDQTEDVFTTCGGYNCRHKWVAVSDEVAQAAA